MGSSSIDQDSLRDNNAESACSKIECKTTSPNSDQGVIPHATTSTLEVVEHVAKGVKEVITEAVAWADEKAVKLTKKDEEGIGPYASPATCAPSDFDVIATAIPSQETVSKDSKQEGIEEDEQVESGEKKR